MSQKGSPFQKGGGGTSFEHVVQTAFTVSLVIGGHAPCLPPNKIIEVAFQNTQKDYQTDDILVIAESALGLHRLVIQAKHNLSFTEANKVFKEVINGFWKDFNNAAIFDKSKDKLVIVKNGLTLEERNHVKTLFNWASNHATSTDFFAEVNRIKVKKEKLQIFNSCFKEANGGVELSQDQLWQVLKCLDVLEYDLLNNGSVDLSHFLNIIKLSKNDSFPASEKDIWNTVMETVVQLNKDGGNLTKESIKERDFIKWFAPEKITPYYKAVAKLRNDSEAILMPIKDSISDFKLNRKIPKADVLNVINSKPFSVISGKPGVGKSALVKDILINDFNKEAFVFRGDQFNEPHLANVFSSLGINESLNDIFSVIALLKNRIIYIDSLEKLLESDPECAFKQLYAFIQKNPDIKIVATSRKYAIDLIVQKFGINQDDIGTVFLDELNENELQAIEERFPKLKPALNNAKVRQLLKSPKYIEYALTAISKISDDLSNVSLAVFKNKLWNTLVVDEINTKGGMPLKRERAFMEIATDRAKQMRLYVKPTDGDSEAIISLQGDNILIQHPTERLYSPAHDILEDWALVRHVTAAFNDSESVNEFFKKLGTEPAIRRAFRLWMEDQLLEESDQINKFIQEAVQSSDLERYWTDELLTAIFKSENSSVFFKNFEKELLDKNGVLLFRCIHIIRTCCKESSYELGKNKALKPIGSGWKEIILFINNHREYLNIYRGAINSLISDWHFKLLFQKEKIDLQEMIAVKSLLLTFIEQMENEDQYWTSDGMGPAREHVINVLFDLAAIAKEEIASIVTNAVQLREANNRRRSDFTSQVIKKILGGIGNEAIARENPDLIINTAWSVWKKRIRQLPNNPDHIPSMMFDAPMDYDSCWGFENKRSFSPSGSYKTPVYNLLMANAVTGVKFCVDLLNYSIDYYRNAKCERHLNLEEITLTMKDDSHVKQWGCFELWAAHRGLSVTHYLIESILMGLEKYLLQLARTKTAWSRKTLEQVVDTLLRKSNNITTTAVVASVAMAYPEEVSDGIVVLAGVRQIYSWDLNRSLQERTPLAPPDNEIPWAQKERHESNSLPHRKRFMTGFSTFIIDYQFNIRIKNEELFKVFDRLKLIDQDDIVWKKTLIDIDARNHKVKEYDEELGGFPIAPEYEEEIADFVESGKESYSKDTLSLMNSNVLLQVFKNEQKITFEKWNEIFLHVKASSNFMYDRPVTLAVVGLRDFRNELTDNFEEWCVNKIVESINKVISDSISRDFSALPTYNFMEREVIMGSFHILVDNAKKTNQEDEVLSLLAHSLFAPLPEHELKDLVSYIRETFFKSHPDLAKRLWLTILEYSKYKKNNHFYLDDPDEDRVSKALNKEYEFIQTTSKSKNIKVNISDIRLADHSPHLLTQALFVIPYDTIDAELVKYRQQYLKLFFEDFEKAESYSYHDDEEEGRKIGSNNWYRIQSYFSKYFLFADNTKSELKIILDAAYKPTEQPGSKFKDDLIEFVAMMLRLTVSKLDILIVDPKNKTVKTAMIDRFWKRWTYLFERVKDSKRTYFMSPLFLDTGWKEEASDWPPLRIGKSFYYELIQEFGKNNTTRILNVFSTIGERAFLPEGLNTLVEIYKSHLVSRASLYSDSANRLIERLFYNHISEIKANKKMIENFIWLLNEMIKLGSSKAYFIRENVITYRKSS
ncbi:MAG: ATP-binding protein [Cyclobacteriaceae bacterium]|nr:ATP-binding protein [Cyclobacteriaceae bacterium]